MSAGMVRAIPIDWPQQEIPLGARILSVIDSYDAMTSSRPYGKRFR